MLPRFCRVRAPEAIMAAPADILALFAVSVREKIAPEDAALTLTEAESVM